MMGVLTFRQLLTCDQAFSFFLFYDEGKEKMTGPVWPGKSCDCCVTQHCIYVTAVRSLGQKCQLAFCFTIKISSAKPTDAELRFLILFVTTEGSRRKIK